MEKPLFRIFGFMVSLAIVLTVSVSADADVQLGNPGELTDAIAAANGGGDPVIVLEDGTYTLGDALLITAAGITVRSLSGNRSGVILEGGGMGGTVTHIFNVFGSSFTVRDVTLQSVSYHAIQLQPDVDDVVIENVHILDTGEQMVKVSYDPGDGTLRSENGRMEGCLLEYSAGIGPQYYIGGIDAHNALNWVVRGNTFRGIRSPSIQLADPAIFFWSNSENTLVERNTVVNCDRGIGFGMGDRGHVGGVIRNNMIYHDSSEGFADVGISLQRAPDAQVYNNTIFQEHSYPNAIEYRFAETTGVLIANNLTNKAIASRDGASATESDNVTGALTDWFNNPSTGDLHLRYAVSGVRDAGGAVAGLTEDYDGESRPHGPEIDIGADEYTAPYQPTDLTVFHRDGQTFITWSERTDLTGEQYRIYRHGDPITAANLSGAAPLVTLPEGTSAYHTERSRDPQGEDSGDYTPLRNYVIEPLGDELADTTGLFVWTVDADRTSYYAITTLTGTGENQIDFGSGNTNGPLAEVAADPSPILIWESTNSLGRVYTQFMDFDGWNPTFETPDGLTYAYNYFVGMPSAEQCGGTLPDDYALILHIEGHGTRYSFNEGSHYFCGVEVWCDDPRQSWYYGYSATHDYSDTEAPVVTGPIVNFTEERLLRAVYDTIRDPHYPIDEQRIYAYGHSMGASGSLALAMRYPDLFSAVYCSEPMTDYQTASLWVGPDLEPKWGAVALNLPIENRGIYAAHLAGHNGMGVWDWQNHQQQLIDRRGDEMAHISLAHGTLDTVIDWDTQGRLAYEPFYLARQAFSAEVVELGHTWAGFAGLGPTVGLDWGPGGGPFFGFSVLRDETLPGLSYASGSLPVPPDLTGGYNVNLEWSASWHAWDGAPLDTTDEWGVSLRTIDGSTQTVDVTPRRLQQFSITAGERYAWENRQVSDNTLVDSGDVVADADGLVTVASFQVTPAGNRLHLSLSAPYPGDLDGDGDCDFDDFLEFRICYRACAGAPNFRPEADFDDDGCVTINDYRIFRTLIFR